MTKTRFEAEWDNHDMHVFMSERHGVFAIADAYPRTPLSCVIVPQHGNSGNRSIFYELPARTKRHMFEVADAIGQKILPHLDDNQRAALRINNYSIIDHPHINISAATRQEIVGDHEALPILGINAIRHTLEVLRFSPVESAELEHSLDQIH